MTEKKTIFYCRVPTRLLSTIADLAAREHRSRSNMIYILLEEAVLARLEDDEATTPAQVSLHAEDIYGRD